MAYNLPMEDSPSNSLRKSFTQGSNLYNMLMQNALRKEQSKRAEAANRRAEEMQPITIQHIMSQIANANSANQRAEGLYPEQLKHAKDLNNPDYEFNKISHMYDLAREKFGRKKSQEENTRNGVEQQDKSALLNKLVEMGVFGQNGQGQGKGALLPEEERPEPGDMNLSEEQLKQMEQEQKNQQPIEEPVTEPSNSGEFTPEEISFGKALEKKTGFNPFTEKKETPQQKRERDTAEKIKLEHIKNQMKQGLEQQKNELKDQKLKQKTIEAAKNDTHVLEETLHSLEVMKEIAAKNPDLFGHNIFGYDTSERFARTTDNPNAGIWQSMGINPIVAAEMKLSSKGNVPALKFAIANKPNFSESQKVAQGKIDSSIEQIKRTLNHNKKISGQDHDVIVIDPSGKKFETTSSNAKHLPKGWQRVEF